MYRKICSFHSNFSTF